tara:strand:- start:6858 stop:7217 length:360 start_codon:yes stop_codon:yes gene_type:complete
MKNKTQIVFLFLILLVITTSTVFAFENPSSEEKTSSSKENSHSEKESCCDNHQKDDDGFNGTCDNSYCHWTTPINIPVFFDDYQLSSTNNLNLLKNYWTYVQHNPEAVYLSIWQPPKIS